MAIHYLITIRQFIVSKSEAHIDVCQSFELNHAGFLTLMSDAAASFPAAAYRVLETIC